MNRINGQKEGFVDSKIKEIHVTYGADAERIAILIIPSFTNPAGFYLI